MELEELELVWYLYNPDHQLVGIAIFIDEAELNSGIVALQVAFHVRYLIVLEVFLDILLQDDECICEIHFQ